MIVNLEKNIISEFRTVERNLNGCIIAFEAYSEMVSDLKNENEQLRKDLDECQHELNGVN